MGLFVDIEKQMQGFTLKVRFEAAAGTVGLLGASGAGKSLTLRCIAGLEKPDRGRIVLNGRVLFDSDTAVNVPCRLRNTGFLFQNYALFPHMTAEDNIRFALARRDKDIASQMLAMTGLDGLEKRYPHQLSGGQQQRLALARTLATAPDVLLLDEPFSALDALMRERVADQLFERLVGYQGLCLFVTHDMTEAYRHCRRLVVLNQGRVEAEGCKEAVFHAPPTLAAGRLTGCSNFSAARYLSPDELVALDWGVKLKTSAPLHKSLKHAGIRPQLIRMASEGDRHNLVNCWLSRVRETPVGMTVYLSLGRPPTGAADYQLQWELSKEQWLALTAQSQPWSICLAPEKLVIIAA